MPEETIWEGLTQRSQKTMPEETVHPLLWRSFMEACKEEVCEEEACEEV